MAPMGRVEVTRDSLYNSAILGKFGQVKNFVGGILASRLPHLGALCLSANAASMICFWR